MKKQHYKVGAVMVLAFMVAAVFAVLGTAGLLATLTALGIGGVPIVFGMILDERSEFCDATSVINAAGLFLVGDVMDLTVARNIGSPPRPLYMVIQVDTTFLAAAGAASVSFIIASDAQAAIAVDGSATVHYESMVIPKATLIAGFAIVVPLPGQKPDYERFLGVLTRIATNPLTAGKINAFLTHDPKQWKALPDAI